ncbi:MAG TPA: hypothetical protein VL175_09720 [Pirellulales bacterium]|jgi:hypothetical protein|nr:hypothetical protein [Pirellulales bacterium]
MQPAFMQAAMQSQQAWHMAQQSSSPLVQVMHTPILVSAHSHLHIDMLHWHISMPFIMQQQLHRLPAIILHMFCKVVAASSSSHVQVIFMPPLHFSIFIVQRGTMHICMDEGATPGMAPVGMPEPIEPIIALSIIMTLAISLTPFVADKELRIPYLESRAILCNLPGRLQSFRWAPDHKLSETPPDATGRHVLSGQRI